MAVLIPVCCDEGRKEGKKERILVTTKLPSEMGVMSPSLFNVKILPSVLAAFGFFKYSHKNQTISYKRTFKL